MPSYFNMLENPSLYFAMSGLAFMLNTYFFLFHATVNIGGDGSISAGEKEGNNHYSFVNALLFGDGNKSSPPSPNTSTSLFDYASMHGIDALSQSPLLAVSLFNFGFAFILYFYQLLHIVFFSSLPSGIEIRQIVDKLYNFFSFKIFLIGLILEPTLLDIGLWILWCLLLGTAKALLQHGILKIEAVIINNPDDSFLTGEAADFDARKVARPAGHLLYMLVFLVGVSTAWHRVLTGGGNTHGHSQAHLWLLVLYDVSTVAIEWVQAASLYGAYVSRALGSRLDMDDALYYINLCSDVSVLAVTLLHFIHVYLMHGISLSITDVLLCLNVRTAAENLTRKVTDACKLYRTKHYFDRIFPSVDKPRKSRSMSDMSVGGGGESDYQLCEGRDGEGDETAEEDVCSICLREYCDTAKLLPCGHSIHKECLKQLLRRATTTASSGGQTDRASHALHYSFKCPLCRKSIDASSGRLIQPGAPTSPADARAAQRPSPAQGQASDAAGTSINSLYREMSWSLFGGLLSFSYTVNSSSNNSLSTMGLTGLQQPGGGSGSYTPSLPYAFSRWSVSEDQINAVADMFPQVPRTAIERDLATSYSVSATVDNILEGRVSALGEAPSPTAPASLRGSSDDLHRLGLGSAPPSTPAQRSHHSILAPTVRNSSLSVDSDAARDRRSYSMASEDAPTERQTSVDSVTSIDSAATDMSISSTLASFRSIFRRRRPSLRQEGVASSSR